MALDSIFLSGWEYNKVLTASPLTPTVSGLPATVLWEGGAHFWLFKNVYCTTDSFIGDYAAYEDLGWSTGYIFSDLKRRGFLKTVDLKTLATENPTVGKKLVTEHDALRQIYDEKKILALLQTGGDVELERIKLKLLRPVLEHLKCVINVSPNSLNNWVDSQKIVNTRSNRVSRAMDALSDPIVQHADQYRSGAIICRRPGSGLPEHILKAQSEAKRIIQKPLIPSLLAGLLPQSDYHLALKGSRKVYEAIDKQLLTDYEEHIGRLEDLRAMAETHIWKDLHNEWLPKLESDPAFLPTFKLLLRDAILEARFTPYLEVVCTLGIALASGAVGAAFGLPAGAGVNTALTIAHKTRRDAIKPYATFYQKVLKTPV